MRRHKETFVIRSPIHLPESVQVCGDVQANSHGVVTVVAVRVAVCAFLCVCVNSADICLGCGVRQQKNRRRCRRNYRRHRHRCIAVIIVSPYSSGCGECRTSQHRSCWDMNGAHVMFISVAIVCLASGNSFTIRCRGASVALLMCLRRPLLRSHHCVLSTVLL